MLSRIFVKMSLLCDDFQIMVCQSDRPAFSPKLASHGGSLAIDLPLFGGKLSPQAIEVGV